MPQLTKTWRLSLAVNSPKIDILYNNFIITKETIYTLCMYDVCVAFYCFELYMLVCTVYVNPTTVTKLQINLFINIVSTPVEYIGQYHGKLPLFSDDSHERPQRY